MYLLLIISFAAIFISAYILTKLFFHHRISALFLLIFTLLYLLPMIGGALGILGPGFLVTSALVALLINLFIYMVKWKSLIKAYSFDIITTNYSARPTLLEILLVIIPVVCSISWITIFFVQSARHKITNYYIPPYSWDVVEYHFPTIVNAVQSGSLWTTFWAHYPMGCELIHSWGFVFLRNDALVYYIHFFFSFLLIFYSCLIIHLLCFEDKNRLSGTEIIAYLIVAIVLLLSPLLWDMQFNQIGKNDIALSAFMTAAVYFYLQYKKETSASKTFSFNLILLGLALGLISGIKPNGLFFSAIFFVIMTIDIFYRKIPSYHLGIVSLCILFLAGFWYFRTLIVLGIPSPGISGTYESIFFNLIKGRNLFLTGREGILFSLSVAFCLFMGVIWHNKDARMRMTNYILAGAIIIFCLTPNSLWQGNIQLRLGPAIIPLVIIMAIATFLRLIVRAGEENKAHQSIESLSRSYQRKATFAWVLFALVLAAILGTFLIGGFQAKPRWAWNLRGLIVIAFLAGALSIYNSAKAPKDYQLKISRGLLSLILYVTVLTTLVIQIKSYEPPGDLVGYNENTSVYRWIYQNIQGKTIYLLGLRPYGLYGKNLSNKVIYGGDSYGSKLNKWSSLIKQEKVDYLVIGRDYAQHEGWYDFKPFPSDLQKIMAMPDIFKLVWSDDRAMIFSINQASFICR